MVVGQPLLAGVLLATAPYGLQIVLPVAQSCRSHRRSPVPASNDSTWSRSCLGPLEQVTMTCPATTMGEAGPRPGSGTFQATFSSSLNVLGRSFWSDTLRLSVPRKCSQSLPEHTAITPNAKANSVVIRLMPAARALGIIAAGQ
jgi:hypothetical protein